MEFIKPIFSCGHQLNVLRKESKTRIKPNSQPYRNISISKLITPRMNEELRSGLNCILDYARHFFKEKSFKVRFEGFRIRHSQRNHKQ